MHVNQCLLWNLAWSHIEGTSWQRLKTQGAMSHFIMKPKKTLFLNTPTRAAQHRSFHPSLNYGEILTSSP